mgnify:CR=1 FL=1
MHRLCHALTLALAVIPASASALAPTSTQGDTLKELIDVIEERHYASRRYDDALSAQHFVAYLDALDPQRMFFDAADITEFSSWKLELDNAGRREGERVVGEEKGLERGHRAHLGAHTRAVSREVPTKGQGVEGDFPCIDAK